MRAFGFVAIAIAMVLSSHAVAQEGPPMPPPVKDGNGRAVLITGASSGFGRRLTEVLSQNGWYVYAGAQSAEDMDALGRMKITELNAGQGYRYTSDELLAMLQKHIDAVEPN
ncbi:hypothetical protein [Prosthecomicrobium sp. N25]|uniref:hypothetical protein n=1 Tax=Prosthecomicrobium sp. N25 TaxID=3129254 RepID=UPI0030773E0F